MSRSKNIVFFTQLYFPHIGGVEKHIHELVQNLPETYKITIVTRRYLPTLKKFETNKNVRIHRIDYPNIKYIGLVLIWIKLLRFAPILIRADIIHVHDVFIWILPFRFIFFWKKIYTTFHGWEGKYPIPKLSLLQKQLAFKLSNGAIAVGEYINKYYSIKCKYVIYGGFTPKTKRVTKKRRIKVIYVGRLETDTGLPILLETIKKNDIHDVVFVGDGLLKGECSTLGLTPGKLIDVSSYLEKSIICISGGYLSTLESLYYGCETVVIAPTKIRQDAFGLSPFNERITLCKTDHDLSKVLLKPDKYETKNRINFSDWAKNQNWKKIANTYLNLWNISM